MQQRNKSRFLVPAIAALVAIGGVTSQVMAEGSSSPAEVQRGVPGVDVDLNKKAEGGLDVDMQAGNQNDKDNGVPGVDVDTRSAGAGPATMDTNTADAGSSRSPIVDRN